MKIRDAVFLVIGGLLVISGMVLNSVWVGDAHAQGSSLDGNFRYITCRSITIVDENGKEKGLFALDTSDNAMLRIYGNDGRKIIASLGANRSRDGEMMFYLKAQSKNDKRHASIHIDSNGGRFDGVNKLGENVASIGVGNKGDGMTDLRDKHGYKR